MMKVGKVKGTGGVAGPEVSAMKKKNENEIPEIVAEMNNTSVTTLAKKKRNRRKNKNKAKTNGTATLSETKNGESSPAVIDIASSTEEKGVKEEPANTATELGQNNTPNTQGKKKRKRKNKRKASEALETTVKEENGLEDQAEGQRGNKRMKVEVEKEGEGDTEEEKAETVTKKGKVNKEGQQPKKKQQEKKHVLFIGNLPYELSEEEVREHFKVVADNIEGIRIMTNKSKKRGKGFGFIQLKDAQSYNKALKLHLSQLKDRKINVEFTTPGRKSHGRRNVIKTKTKKLLGQKKMETKKGRKMKKIQIKKEKKIKKEKS